MDKTTTWLIRGAALTVIFVGFFNYLKPEMKRQSEIKSYSDRQYESYETKKRCENFPTISETEFRNFYQEDLIKEVLVSPDNLPIQINTSKGNFLTDIYPSEDREPSLLRMFTDKDIPIKVGGPRMCKYKD